MIGLTVEDDVVVEQVNELMVNASDSMLTLPMNEAQFLPTRSVIITRICTAFSLNILTCCMQ